MIKKSYKSIGSMLHPLEWVKIPSLNRRKRAKGGAHLPKREAHLLTWLDLELSWQSVVKGIKSTYFQNQTFTLHFILQISIFSWELHPPYEEMRPTWRRKIILRLLAEKNTPECFRNLRNVSTLLCQLKKFTFDMFSLFYKLSIFSLYPFFGLFLPFASNIQFWR